MEKLILVENNKLVSTFLDIEDWNYIYKKVKSKKIDSLIMEIDSGLSEKDKKELVKKEVSKIKERDMLMNLSKGIGIETFTLIKRGRIVSKLVRGDNLVFLTNQINIDGLTDFHLTIEYGLSDNKKIELLDETIKGWGKERGVEIFNL